MTSPDHSLSMTTTARHMVTKHPLVGPFPGHSEQAHFAMGCFWGAEKCFWEQTGVYVTSVGYAGGEHPYPSYQEICTGETGHCEVVQVIYLPAQISYAELLQVFWHAHDPTQGMRQGNDIGSQYRSAIYTNSTTQQKEAQTSKSVIQKRLREIYGKEKIITTEIVPMKHFYYAEKTHQQYLAKDPDGYCGLKGLLPIR